MSTKEYSSRYAKNLTRLITEFRVDLAFLKGVKKKIDLQAAKEELNY